MFLRFAIVLVVSGTTALAASPVPATINHQGVVSVNGTRFAGPSGLFKFAIRDSQGLNVWTHDGTNLIVGGIPTGSIQLPVSNGVYTVVLGNTTNPVYPAMTSIQPSVFSNDSTTYLRIWFNDTVNGWQQLVPDQSLTSAPYSHQNAFQPPVGSIIAWHRNPNPNNPNAVIASSPPDGWMECNGDPLPMDSPIRATGATSVPDLNDVPPGTGGGRFLRGSSVSGVMQGASEFKQLNEWGWFQWDNAGAGLDSTATISVFGNAPSSLVGGPELRPGYKSTVRPVNMSVVWIMRVK